MSASVKHSNQTNEQYTPVEYTDAAREVLGSIDLDPATSLIANERVRADRIYTIDDGLQTFRDDWMGTVFLNPPGGKKLVVRNSGMHSNPAIFWAKLMFEWHRGTTTAAIVLGFTIEVLQTTQAEEEYPMLRFPFCIPRKRIKFDLPRLEKIKQLQARLAKVDNGKSLGKKLAGQIQALELSTEEIVPGDDPPHANVLVFVPPREEHNFGIGKHEEPWVAWGGPACRRFQRVFSSLGYVRL